MALETAAPGRVFLLADCCEVEDTFCRQLVGAVHRSSDPVQTLAFCTSRGRFVEEVENFSSGLGSCSEWSDEVVGVAGADDWIVIPGFIPRDRDHRLLAEYQILSEARRLGYKVAFIFHGAERMKNRKITSSEKQLYALYMQTLMLADAVFPVSRLAADDIRDYFLIDQSADSVPYIVKLGPPADAWRIDVTEWDVYFRTIVSTIRKLSVDSVDAGPVDFIGVPPGQRKSDLDALLADALQNAKISVNFIHNGRAESGLSSGGSHTSGTTAVNTIHGTHSADNFGDAFDGRQSDGWLFVSWRHSDADLERLFTAGRSAGQRTCLYLDETESDLDGVLLSRWSRNISSLVSFDLIVTFSSGCTEWLRQQLLVSRCKFLEAERRIVQLEMVASAAGHSAQRHCEKSISHESVKALVRALVGFAVGNVARKPFQSGCRRESKNLSWFSDRPKLSICISTYKRAGWLSVNLSSLFAQIPNPSSRIEVLVVDNESPDDTPAVAALYAHRPDFRYHRNAQNVGMLGNLAVTSQLSRGEYVWILGDDDLVKPGAISYILEMLEVHPEARLVYLNYGYTFEHDFRKVVDFDHFFSHHEILEQEGPDQIGRVSDIAANSENFYTAIYCIIFRREHAIRAYSQDTSGRIFSTMQNCIPSSYYILDVMSDMPAIWIGRHCLVMNSNVSWADYSPLFELEHFPRAWDMAELSGTEPAAVDARRVARLPHTVNAWRQLFTSDEIGNGAFVSVFRVLMRLKHMHEISRFVPEMFKIYNEAFRNGHSAAVIEPEKLFAAFSREHAPLDEAVF